MKQNIFTYLIGTAGSGKSTLTSICKRWMDLQGIDSIILNLDPGAENLPYDPDIDIRDWISLSEIMDTHKLGPNGAQIACADMLALNTTDIKESLDQFKSDYVFVDTPGQLELFVFRESGKYIIDSLQPNRSVVAYLIDQNLAKNPHFFVSQLLLSLTTNFRLAVPQVNLLSKSDLLDPSEIDQLVSWAQDPDGLEFALSNQKPSIYREMNEEIIRLVSHFQSYGPLIPTGKEDYLGVDDLYTMVQLLFQGGEDVRPD